MKHQHISLPFCEGGFELIIEPHFTNVIKWLNDGGYNTDFLDSDRDDNPCCLRVWKKDKSSLCNILFLPDVQDSIQGRAIIFHEIFHMAGSILHSKGIFYDNSYEARNEIYAYTIDYIYRLIAPHLEISPTKRRKK